MMSVAESKSGESGDAMKAAARFSGTGSTPHQVSPQNAIVGRGQRGRKLAVLACGIILFDTLCLLGVLLWVLGYSRWDGNALAHLFAASPLPVLIYLLWLLGVAGTTAAIVAVLIYDFRERWFWRFLVIGSVAWLAFPPVHAMIGLVALVTLLACRQQFPPHQ